MAPRPKYKRPASRPASRVVQGESSQVRQMGESRIRLICIAAFFGLSFTMLATRLLEVSLMGGGDLPFKKLVSHPELLIQREDDVDVSKVAADEHIIRREITDRNGMVLATSIETASLVANPTIIRHEPEVARGLAKIFPDQSYDALLNKLSHKKSTFLYIKRHLTPAEQEAVNNLGVPGLFFEPDTRRVYPYGGLFAHTLGYVGVDNQGLAGIEKYFDAQLEDPLKHEPLQLSLDLRVQSIVRDELAKAVKEFSAIGGTGIVMDIKTGELLAVANLPEFDPHQPGKASDNARFNRATLGAYEMGSTFKSFTMAAALDYGINSISDGYDASQPLRMAGFTITDYHGKGRWLSLPEIYAYSSNIGTAKAALAIGKERQQEFLRELGMFEPVKMEVPELAKPQLPRQWGDLATMTVSYGHGISVSPIHLVRGIAAIAGDGRLHPVTLVKGGTANKKASERVVKESTTKDMRDMMRLVVAHGTAKGAEAPGYSVGGKTGTAEKITGRGYSQDAKIALFTGVFPVNDPKYAMLVMVDEPHGTKASYGYATGGWVSAPVVGRVVQRMAPMMGMKPNFMETNARVDAMWASAEARAKEAETRRLQRLHQGAIRAASF
ncbi:MAG: penicillin-binding protein [Azospirillum brasilense]|nr:MAG: penicillin-binding protein [Azospirillum brasilense]